MLKNKQTNRKTPGYYWGGNERKKTWVDELKFCIVRISWKLWLLISHRNAARRLEGLTQSTLVQQSLPFTKNWEPFWRL